MIHTVERCEFWRIKWVDKVTLYLTLAHALYCAECIKHAMRIVHAHTNICTAHTNYVLWGVGLKRNLLIGVSDVNSSGANIQTFSLWVEKKFILICRPEYVRMYIWLWKFSTLRGKKQSLPQQLFFLLPRLARQVMAQMSIPGTLLEKSFTATESQQKNTVSQNFSLMAYIAEAEIAFFPSSFSTALGQNYITQLSFFMTNLFFTPKGSKKKYNFFSFF